MDLSQVKHVKKWSLLKLQKKLKSFDKTLESKISSQITEQAIFHNSDIELKYVLMCEISDEITHQSTATICSDDCGSDQSTPTVNTI